MFPDLKTSSWGKPKVFIFEPNHVILLASSNTFCFMLLLIFFPTQKLCFWQAIPDFLCMYKWIYILNSIFVLKSYPNLIFLKWSMILNCFSYIIKKLPYLRALSPSPHQRSHTEHWVNCCPLPRVLPVLRLPLLDPISSWHSGDKLLPKTRASWSQLDNLVDSHFRYFLSALLNRLFPILILFFPVCTQVPWKKKAKY